MNRARSSRARKETKREELRGRRRVFTQRPRNFFRSLSSRGAVTLRPQAPQKVSTCSLDRKPTNVFSATVPPSGSTPFALRFSTPLPIHAPLDPSVTRACCAEGLVKPETRVAEALLAAPHLRDNFKKRTPTTEGLLVSECHKEFLRPSGRSLAFSFLLALTSSVLKREPEQSMSREFPTKFRSLSSFMPCFFKPSPSRLTQDFLLQRGHALASTSLFPRCTRSLTVYPTRGFAANRSAGNYPSERSNRRSACPNTRQPKERERAFLIPLLHFDLDTQSNVTMQRNGAVNMSNRELTGTENRATPRDQSLPAHAQFINNEASIHL